ncbi:MAG: TIGR01459 family HAD-type hydrolase [Alphaproteobacteria bacterium]|nr:TIGR01459 family HAD-type hydrolase [Alphaproteobacteria bacterium]MBM3653951.1 TIGR01459 family HAD-type hydrolase [Alphaproteobacteria bacterium]
MTSGASERSRVPFVAGLHELAAGYDAILCDGWGVLIDGRRHFPEAAEALKRFRARGGSVVLITNASRPDDEIRRQLLGLGVPQDCFDDLVSAGELALREIVARVGQAVYHLGPSRDDGLFREAARRLGAPVMRVGPEAADYVVCTGLLNERNEAPADYDEQLAILKARDLTMLCANPDIVVAVGNDLVYCAGALAERYAAIGGRVLTFGKPHAPIYAAARERLQKLRGDVDPSRILAIGDGAFTDLAGAGRAGFDCLFVLHGVHRDELHPEGGALDEAALESLFARAGARPKALARELFW